MTNKEFVIRSTGSLVLLVLCGIFGTDKAIAGITIFNIAYSYFKNK